MKTGRGLSASFLDALQNEGGLGLNRLLLAVKTDDTLCLEIRENSINIYYRGGNLIRLEEKQGKFLASFDRRYILEPEKSKLPAEISQCPLKCREDVALWIDAIPYIKLEMDHWFHFHPKEEREAQQLIVRENNFGGAAKSTDYFICDIEYANECGRFDLIAAHWPAIGSARKNNHNVGLAFIEFKYMNKAMANTAGICAHVQDMKTYYENNPDHFASLKNEMIQVFKQKWTLGLIDIQKPIECFNEEMPDFILALANHDPESRILLRELKEIAAIAPSLPFSVKFAVSNFLGYGLYDQNIYGLEAFMERYKEQIH
jgi:hypothetical protein